MVAVVICLYTSLQIMIGTADLCVSITVLYILYIYIGVGVMVIFQVSQPGMSLGFFEGVSIDDQ